MNHFRFTKLALLVIAVGALILAGCGSDGSTGPKGDPGTAPSAEDVAEALLADPDAVDALKGDSGEDGMDADPADSLTPEEAAMATYESIFGPAVEDEFEDMLDADPSILEIRNAILALATKYGDPNPNTIAGLEANLVNHFAGEAPTEAKALEYLQALRTAGFLSATRERVITMLTASGDAGLATAVMADQQATQAEIDDVWESVFTPAVETQFTAMVGTNPSIARIVSTIRQIATQYGVTDPDALRGLEANAAAYFSGTPPTTSTALMYFQAWRARGWLPATQARAAAVLVAQGGGITAATATATNQITQIANYVQATVTAALTNLTLAAVNTAIGNIADDIYGSANSLAKELFIEDAKDAAGAVLRGTAPTAAKVAKAVTDTARATVMKAEEMTAGMAATYLANVNAAKARMASGGGPGQCPAGQTGTPPNCVTPPPGGGGTMSVIQVGGLSTNAATYDSGWERNANPATTDGITHGPGTAKVGFAGITNDYTIWGGWADHQSFGVLRNGNAFSVGTPTGAAPVLGSGMTAEWKGVLKGYATAGTGLADDETAQGDAAGFVTGTVRIEVINDPAQTSLMADVTTSIDGLAGGSTPTAVDTLSWLNMPIGAGGDFGMGRQDEKYISGQFYGAGAAEAGGVFIYVVDTTIPTGATNPVRAPLGNLDTTGDKLTGAFGAAMVEDN